MEGQGAALLPVSSPSTPSVLTEEGSATQSPGRAAECLFSDSSIQDIVDRYTRELNLSLGATGRSTGALPQLNYHHHSYYYFYIILPIYSFLLYYLYIYLFVCIVDIVTNNYIAEKQPNLGL